VTRRRVFHFAARAHEDIEGQCLIRNIFYLLSDAGLDREHIAPFGYIRSMYANVFGGDEE
jgi:hypothetical protein